MLEFNSGFAKKKYLKELNIRYILALQIKLKVVFCIFIDWKGIILTNNNYFESSAIYWTEIF